MKLQASIGKKKYHFEVTPIVDSKTMLFFLVQLTDGQLMVAQREEKNGAWLKATHGQISNALSAAILKKIESASVYMLLEKLVNIEQINYAV